MSPLFDKWTYVFIFKKKFFGFPPHDKIITAKKVLTRPNMYCTIMYSGMDGFDWDEWNTNKNWIGHKVTYRECEEVFFNEPRIIYKDIKHSTLEDRFGMLGETDNRRWLHITFTIRENNIRVISARDQNKKERKYYESRKQKNK